jgi:hypothetical protein
MKTALNALKWYAENINPLVIMGSKFFGLGLIVRLVLELVYWSGGVSEASVYAGFCAFLAIVFNELVKETYVVLKRYAEKNMDEAVTGVELAERWSDEE